MKNLRCRPAAVDVKGTFPTARPGRRNSLATLQGASFGKLARAKSVLRAARRRHTVAINRLFSASDVLAVSRGG